MEAFARWSFTGRVTECDFVSAPITSHDVLIVAVALDNEGSTTSATEGMMKQVPITPLPEPRSSIFRFGSWDCHFHWQMAGFCKAVWHHASSASR